MNRILRTACDQRRHVIKRRLFDRRAVDNVANECAHRCDPNLSTRQSNARRQSLHEQTNDDKQQNRERRRALKKH